jgi:vitamin B12 transporter
MKFCSPHWRLAALPVALSVVWPLASLAQAEPLLATTVVTANRTPQALADLVADVSILDRHAIERSGAGGLAELLARQPGVQLARNGGPGGVTGLYVRGAEQRFTAVYLDGVRVDSQSTGGAFWEQIPLAQIERIELLRGPAAAVYGSDAIGGVVQLFTKKGEADRAAPFVGVAAGSHRSLRMEAGVSGRTGTDGAIDYALGVSKERSHGFDAQPQRLRDASAGPVNHDADGYARLSGNARLGWQLNRAHRLEATLLASRLESQYDDWLASPAQALTDDRSDHRLRTAGLSWSAQWSSVYSTQLQWTDSRTRYETTPSPYWAETDLQGLLWQNTWRWGAHRVSAALERREDALHGSGTAGARHQNALALGYGLSNGPHTLQLNLRRDDDSDFGGQTTGSAAYGLALTPQWRATVSAGTAFRAPTLYQRFGDSGAAGLRPEEGRNIEVGLRWTQGASSLGVVAYRNRVQDLIVYGAAGPCLSSWGCYENVGRGQYAGVTVSGQHAIGALRLRGSLDLQNPRDRDSGKLLARRAQRFATVGADLPVAGWTLGAEVQMTGQRFDDSANTTRLGGYTLLNLVASRPIARDFQLTARVDNLTDRDYQTVRHYANGGRQFWLALKWAPR